MAAAVLAAAPVPIVIAALVPIAILVSLSIPGEKTAVEGPAAAKVRGMGVVVPAVANLMATALPAIPFFSSKLVIMLL